MRIIFLFHVQDLTFPQICAWYSYYVDLVCLEFIVDMCIKYIVYFMLKSFQLYDTASRNNKKYQPISCNEEKHSNRNKKKSFVMNSAFNEYKWALFYHFPKVKYSIYGFKSIFVWTKKEFRKWRHTIRACMLSVDWVRVCVCMWATCDETPFSKITLTFLTNSLSLTLNPFRIYRYFRRYVVRLNAIQLSLYP